MIKCKSSPSAPKPNEKVFKWHHNTIKEFKSTLELKSMVKKKSSAKKITSIPSAKKNTLDAKVLLKWRKEKIVDLRARYLDLRPSKASETERKTTANRKTDDSCLQANSSENLSIAVALREPSSLPPASVDTISSLTDNKMANFPLSTLSGVAPPQAYEQTMHAPVNQPSDFSAYAAEILKPFLSVDAEIGDLQTSDWLPMQEELASSFQLPQTRLNDVAERATYQQSANKASPLLDYSLFASSSLVDSELGGCELFDWLADFNFKKD